MDCPLRSAQLSDGQRRRQNNNEAKLVSGTNMGCPLRNGGADGTRTRGL
jgi:hypothetical protein